MPPLSQFLVVFILLLVIYLPCVGILDRLYPLTSLLKRLLGQSFIGKEGCTGGCFPVAGFTLESRGALYSRGRGRGRGRGNPNPNST